MFFVDSIFFVQTWIQLKSRSVDETRAAQVDYGLAARISLALLF
jgi:hypothetical protein